MAENVERLRTEQNMNYKQLSERLEGDAGWLINAVGIRRIESRERRVTPDDLVALAVALRVSPITLLIPNSLERAASVEVTGISESCTAEGLWKWMRADRPLKEPADGVELLNFIARATPAWRSREYAEGVQQLLEIRQLEGALESDDQQAVAAANRRLEEMWKNRVGDD